MAPESVHSTVVAIDRDKNSQFAIRWATDHLADAALILVHVTLKSPNPNPPAFSVDQLFNPFRGFCARKGVKMEEVVLEETDTSKALLDYINSNFISNIVVGASTRNAFARTFKHNDVPTTIVKSAPDYCSVYVIAKGKAVQVRPRVRPVTGSNGIGPPRHSSLPTPPSHKETDAVERRHSLKKATQETLPDEEKKKINLLKSPRRSRTMSAPTYFDLDFPNECLIDPEANPSTQLADAPISSKNEVEAEMERLKLELKQTMDMYRTACKEAISAQQKAVELNKWKLEELHRIEEAKNAEVAALAKVETEKAKSKAAIEAAMAAQKLAALEAQKRRDAELKANRDLEEMDTTFSFSRYRKYSIEEIEEATDRFSLSMKIGEGGYGPVFKGKLDHTPVAIKVLRPDAAQGRKQFQQEVEVLCCIRHPNMVLLLGACPEYGCLVYEYMENGSLEDRLLKRGDSPPLPWRIRFKIAAEITTALLFLHQAKPEPLVHRDLKPANILIDRHYVSKISDVGLARLVPPSVADSVTQYHVTSAAGTFCYIDPEYQQTGKLTPKSDIYSLGVMLLQVITVRPAMGIAHHVRNAISGGNLEEILDPAVTDWPMEEALAFATLALQCTELSKKDRPDLGTVIVPELNRLWDVACASHIHSQNPFFP